MWMFATCGFYSIVRKPGDELLTVRSRAREDLERLRERYLPKLGPIAEGTGSDYQFRARVGTADLGEALGRIVSELAYSNFKNAVAADVGPARAKTCGSVWQVLRAIEHESPRTSFRAMAYGGIVLDDDGRVLLREPTGHYGGYVWTFAKGQARPGESGEEAALREVREETGVTGRIVSAVPGDFGGDTSVTKYYLMRRVADHDDFDPTETASVRWATFDDARDMISRTQTPRGRERDLAVLRWVAAAAFEREGGG